MDKIVQVDPKKIIQQRPHCYWPRCNHEADTSDRLELTNEKDAGVELPFCFYHYYITMGQHFKAKKIDKIDSKTKKVISYDFEMVGPFKQIELMEQVMAAKEMIAQYVKTKNIPPVVIDQKKCRVCGCTEKLPCSDDGTGRPCSWTMEEKNGKLVETDLCSACANKGVKK